MDKVDIAANSMKKDLELAIVKQEVNGKTKNSKDEPFSNGHDAKQSLIRSGMLINHIHELTKEELIQNNVNPQLIYPPLKSSKPEIKLTGLLKQKDQDVAVVPTNEKKISTSVNWGPMINSGLTCEFGNSLSEKILTINVRSQLSSLAKNSDTLFERMFAESLNLHAKYPNIVMGEVYIIPVYEYEDRSMHDNKVSFKTKHTNIEKYINFFHFLNGRTDSQDEKHKYEKCALIIIDFSKTPAKVYKTTAELKQDNLVQKTFNLELSDISFSNFIPDLLSKYSERFGLTHILNT